MACETAVVASAVGGIKEVVVDGETGFLVPLEQTKEGSFEPTNPEKFARDLAERINQLMKDRQLRERFGKAGRKRVEEHFSWASIAQKTESALRDISPARRVTQAKKQTHLHLPGSGQVDLAVRTGEVESQRATVLEPFLRALQLFDLVSRASPAV